MGRAPRARCKATKYTDAWTGFTNARKNWAYRQDQLPSTHPVAADNHDLEAVEVNFDGITYAKGASTLKQLVAWVGEDEFLSGLRDYFKKHAFANSEFADLLSALEAVSGRDLASWAEEWLQTSGVNTLTPDFEVDDDGAFTSFAVEQAAHPDFPTLRRHRIAIGLYETEGGRLVRRHHVETDIDGASTESPSWSASSSPALVLLNDGDLTYAKIRLDERSLATLVASIDTLDDSLARALCWGAAWDMTRDAEMAATDFAALVLRGVGTETDLTAVGALLRYAKTAVDAYSAPENRDGPARPAGRPACASSRWPPSRAATTSSRSSAPSPPRPTATPRSTGSPGWYDGSAPLDGPLRRHRPALAAALRPVRQGRAGEEEIEAEQQRDSTISGQERAASARAAHPDRGGQGGGLAGRRRARQHPQRDAAPDRGALPGVRRRGAARAVRRPLPRRGRDGLGVQGRPAVPRGAAVDVPPHARHPGRARPGQGVAGRQPGQPRGGALRARGRRRRRRALAAQKFDAAAG